MVFLELAKNYNEKYCCQTYLSNIKGDDSCSIVPWVFLIWGQSCEITHLIHTCNQSI
jgi:hypothetical protein